eukprot:GHVS01038307.1.p1 GENE.GHVS01038307.1~~GHVS01038307.1.p1  ORF type:complete len:434 (+),score=77.87 GHVS01038307.1:106-1302(+)
MARMLIGLGGGGQSIAGYVLAAELVSADYRQLVTMWAAMSFLFSCLMVCLAAMFTPSWRALSFVAALPSLLLLFMWWSKYNIESPRWYAAKGKMEQAQAVWRRIATVNRRTAASLPPLERNHVAAASADREGLFDVASTWPFQMWLACMLSMWFACSTLYYGGSLYLGKDAEHWRAGADVDGMRRLAVTTIWCFVWEAVVTVASLSLADRWGRKAVTTGGLIVSGGLAVTGYVVYLFPIGKIFSHYAALAGRVASSTSFTVIYLYTAELFPTSVRGVSTGVCSVGARVAGTLVPLFVKLDDRWPASPLLLFGVIGIASGVTGLLLPETLNRPLQSTLREGSWRVVRRPCHLAEFAAVVGRPSLRVLSTEDDGKFEGDEQDRLSDLTDDTASEEELNFV